MQDESKQQEEEKVKKEKEGEREGRKGQASSPAEGARQKR